MTNRTRSSGLAARGSRRVGLSFAAGLSVLVLASGSTETVRGQSAAPETPASDEPKRPPSLDELLGLEEPETAEGAEAVADRAADEELQRRLDEKSISDQLEGALVKMALSADQLEKSFDTGLGTQRIQEEVLAQLSDLLAEAKKQSGSGSMSSSSSSPSPQPQSNPQPGKQSGGQPQRSDESSPESQEGEAPPMQDGDRNAVIDEARTEWGSLPDRVREMLLQGRKEAFSSLYEELTREYYRRLAEEGSP